MADKDPNIPEYFGRTKQDFAIEKANQYGAIGSLGGAAVGAGAGYFIKEPKFVKSAAEFLETKPRNINMIVFGAGAAIAVGGISKMIGYSKGVKRGDAAEQQHRELYERLNKLEAAQGAQR